MLTDRQVARLCKVFLNTFYSNKEKPKTSRIIYSGGFLGDPTTALLEVTSRTAIEATKNIPEL